MIGNYQTNYVNALVDVLCTDIASASLMSQKIKNNLTRTERSISRYKRGDVEWSEFSIKDWPDRAVVAMPFSMSSILLIRSSLFYGERNFFVLKTPLSVRYLERFMPQNGGVEFISASEMLKLQADRYARLVFITFPDHTIGSSNTNIAVEILGASYLFHALEPLLCEKHSAALLAFDGESIKEYRCRETNTDFISRAEKSITWLAKIVERWFLLYPESVFSWNYFAQKSSTALRNRYFMRLEAIKGLRCWAFEDREVREFIFNLISMIDQTGSDSIGRLSMPSAQVLRGNNDAF